MDTLRPSAADSDLPMNKILICVLALLVHVLFASSAVAATQFYKCNSNGAVQYQQSPCQTNEETKKPPTVEELNAERQKKLE
jgi:uncharacterized protein YxeA